jgi:2,3-bisphosphoglycerate-independent phosphoglycerate mutase
VETVDECLGRVLDAVSKRGGVALVTADHGNAEQMIDPSTGEPQTAHTTYPVPLIVCGPGGALSSGGTLADVAPTLLGIQGLGVPPEMKGRDLRGPA